MTEDSNDRSKEGLSNADEPSRRCSNFSKTETTQETSQEDSFRPKIRWPDFAVQLFIHIGCLYGLYLCLVSAKFYTTLFGKKTNSQWCTFEHFRFSIPNDIRLRVWYHRRCSQIMVTQSLQSQMATQINSSLSVYHYRPGESKICLKSRMQHKLYSKCRNAIAAHFPTIVFKTCDIKC